MRFSSVLLLLVVVLFSSCLKEDTPVKPHQPGDAIPGSFNMGDNYKFVYYFDIENNAVVGQHLKNLWDIAFDSRQGKYVIKVNPAKFCKIFNTGQTNFDAVTDTTGAIWRADVSSGNPDSTAVGTWGAYSADTAISNGTVYIINRGYSDSNALEGLAKFKIDGANTSYYQITFSNLDGTGLSTVTIPRDDTYNYNFLSLNNGGEIVTAEPPKNSWDLVFTQYTHIFYIPYTPYLVTGILTNPAVVRASADSTNSFESISLADTAAMNFPPDVDIIGYDWKQFDFNSGTYTVKPFKNYIVRSRSGFYYKLRFTDFYKDGIKGNIAFEYQLL